MPEQIDPEIQKIITRYENEVIKSVFPKYSPTVPIIIENEQNNRALLASVSYNGIYKDSEYYYDGKLRFIHYTSLKNLINIFNERKLRLTDFTILADPSEFIGNTEVLSKKDQSYFKTNKDYYKQQLLGFSFCEYANRKSESFDMWRLYGQDGNGVGLIFEVADTNRPNWTNFLMAKVRYSKKQLEKIRRFSELHERFIIDNKFEILNHVHIILPALCFHKKNAFKNENEVRIIRHESGLSMKARGEITAGVNEKIRSTLNDKNKRAFYYELPVLSYEDKLKMEETDMKWPDFDYRHSPQISFKGVVLGYKYSNQEFEHLSKSINQIYRHSYRGDLPLEILESRFKKEIYSE